ncbi:MAG: cytochrome c family protein [Pseudomonadota bacterium]
MTINKIAGAAIGAVLLVMGLNIVAAGVYHAEAPEKTAIAIELPEAEGTGTAAEAEAPKVSLASLLASADAAKGENAFKACKACHTVEDGGKNKVGPNLYDIVDHAIGTRGGFAYSDALKEKASEKWTFENLDAFIAKPKAWAPGTKMGYGGMKREAQRADLLAYLRTLSANPAALPADEAAAAEQSTPTETSAEQPTTTEPAAEQPKE